MIAQAINEDTMTEMRIFVIPIIKSHLLHRPNESLLLPWRQLRPCFTEEFESSKVALQMITRNLTSTEKQGKTYKNKIKFRLFSSLN